MTGQKLWKKLGYEFVPASIAGQIKSLTEIRGRFQGDAIMKNSKLIGEINSLLDKLSKAIQ